jgi:hypothetical protein
MFEKAFYDWKHLVDGMRIPDLVVEGCHWQAIGVFSSLDIAQEAHKLVCELPFVEGTLIRCQLDGRWEVFAACHNVG